MRKEYAIIVHHDSAALLSTMLERLKTDVAQTGNIDRCRRHDAKDPAFLMRTHASRPALAVV